MSVRRAVRDDLALLQAGDRIIVACSGGADSLALLSAAIVEAPAFAITVGMVTVDHQLQEGSEQRAKELLAQVGDLVGFAEVATVTVDRTGSLEAAARVARYAALDEAADRHGAAAIYLAHHAGDQAENVLLGLARGSGARSLSGMAAVAGRYRRPLLALSGEQVRKEGWANHLGITPWVDPHNSDDSFLRSRTRHRVLPVLEAELGPGIEDALSRSARLLREDADALDALAATLISDQESGLSVHVLEAQPRAIRARAILQWTRAAGVPALSAEHVDRIDALIARWRGQGPVALPGGWSLAREGSDLRLSH